ncbi:MAG: cation:proton antiporter, partial [candidate division Zixibacteria bacterium]|nr:cation:proton antiporter [candidate division Zixibacteria bacterium]
MEFGLLKDILVIFGLSIVVVLVFYRVKLPSIVGLLATGVLAGPHGLGLVSAVHQVDILAEIGVILLLFTIGVEFSFKSLWEIK